MAVSRHILNVRNNVHRFLDEWKGDYPIPFSKMVDWLIQQNFNICDKQMLKGCVQVWFPKARIKYNG